MSHISSYESDKKVNFLDSPVGLVLKTCTVPASMGIADEKGNKIAPAGTVFPANDSTATGILFEDVDVTEGDHEGSLLVAGRVYEERLAEESVEADAKTALEKAGIAFVTPVYAERN